MSEGGGGEGVEGVEGFVMGECVTAVFFSGGGW